MGTASKARRAEGYFFGPRILMDERDWKEDEKKIEEAMLGLNDLVKRLEAKIKDSGPLRKKGDE